MTKIIDKRPLKGTSGNRERLLKRLNKEIKKGIGDAVVGGTIKDITSGSGSVKIPVKGVREPRFRHNPDTGKVDRVLPGNKDFNKGDLVEKPRSGGGRGGKQGSKDGENGEDDFTIILSKQEFLDYFFNDLELPNFIKKALGKSTDVKYSRAGFTNDGPQNRLDVQRSFKNSLARRIGVENSLKKKIEELKKEMDTCVDIDRLRDIADEITTLERRLKNMLFFEAIDLKFKHYEKVTTPINKALMIMIMDVSGSMGFDEKDIAKRFFLLLYLFLQKNYTHVEMVFIRHTTEAKEVSELEFFEGKESGGTVVATALELANSIIMERFPLTEWNIYVAQASDGDVWDTEDAINCKDIVTHLLLPRIQYMAYVDIQPSFPRESNLYKTYKLIENEKFEARQINSVIEIWPVFKKLFEKEKK